MIIKAIFKRTDGVIDGYELTGHANFSNHGTDIVCSAVSALFLTITRELRLSSTHKQDGDTHAVNVHKRSLVTDTLLLALKNGLTSIADEHPNNIEVLVVDES